MDDQIRKLKEYYDESNRAIAITGAGISFSAGGLSFDHSKPEEMQEMMILASEDGLKNEPERYYKELDKAFLHSMFEIGPSPAHRILAQMESEGKLRGIITTNVDCLHTMAGSSNVLEIQGSLQVNKCADCGKHYDDYTIWSHGTVPECPACGGKIWPFPFYSGVGLNDPVVKQARKLISAADLILIIGANGSYGNAYWPFRNRRAKIVQINPGETAFDRVADLNIHRDADSVLTELMEAEGDLK